MMTLEDEASRSWGAVMRFWPLVTIGNSDGMTIRSKENRQKILNNEMKYFLH
jgi:hypothetical protein